jgi:hypothetical protein
MDGRQLDRLPRYLVLQAGRRLDLSIPQPSGGSGSDPGADRGFLRPRPVRFTRIHRAFELRSRSRVIFEQPRSGGHRRFAGCGMVREALP